MDLSHGLQIALVIMDMEYVCGARWTAESVKSLARLLFPGWLPANWSSHRALDCLADRGLVCWDSDCSAWFLTDAGREAAPGVAFRIDRITTAESMSRGGIYGMVKPVGGASL